MKIQELAIIFIIIILPISLLLSEYTQFQIQTIALQTEYDTRLTAATYDAIRAFQLNSANSTTSDLANSKMRDLEASIATFRNSIMTGFELNGYTEDDLNNYIPALVYTLYDGFYIYSPYENVANPDGTIDTEDPLEKLYGLKPYISYSCRYIKTGIDVVITYSLDNQITVQGMIRDDATGNEMYVNKTGYLIDNIKIEGEQITYNEIDIPIERLQENIGSDTFRYVKMNGTKQYLINNKIAYISNGKIITQENNNFELIKTQIQNNNLAREYYRQAKEFTEWFKDTNLDELTYGDAIGEIISDSGTMSTGNLFTDLSDTTKKIFNFKDDHNNVNIENELSTFNQHRLQIIRHKIETNLAIAIANYNAYSGAGNVFQMPKLEEDEWDYITHNITLISFLQGLPIGGKMYNGYALVTNSESEEVVLEENIYILGKDSSGKYNYHKVGDKGFTNGSITVDDGVYGNGLHCAGRLNTDFDRKFLATDDGKTYYYYPLSEYYASYDSVVMQNNVNTYEDIYAYVNNSGNNDLKQAFYTALGRERASKYNSIVDTNATLTLDPTEGAYLSGQLKITATVTKGTKVRIPPVEANPIRDGFEFMGYSKDKNASVGTYQPNQEITLYEDLVLYAVWKAENATYTLTFNPNEGWFSGKAINEIITQQIENGENIISDVPIRTGYTFKGWNRVDTAEEENISPNSVFGESCNMDFKAVWERNSGPVSVTFDANGGSGVQTSWNVMIGAKINLPLPNKPGATFKGWEYTTESGETGMVGRDNLTNFTITGKTDFVAIWE